MGERDIIEHYGDPQLPAQLRIFAETVMGRGLGGDDGIEMRKMMVELEREDTAISTVDDATGNLRNEPRDGAADA